jgi:hypothetical protein
MTFKKHIYLGIMAAFLMSLLFGCSGPNQYGRLGLNRTGMTIEKLSENWKDYYVFYIGASATQPYSISFDPKADDRKLMYHEWWVQVEDQEELSDLIRLLNVYTSQLYVREILNRSHTDIYTVMKYYAS